LTWLPMDLLMSIAEGKAFKTIESYVNDVKGFQSYLMEKLKGNPVLCQTRTVWSLGIIYRCIKREKQRLLVDFMPNERHVSIYLSRSQIVLQFHSMKEALIQVLKTFQKVLLRLRLLTVEKSSHYTKT
jgi:hypothetical protein